ncbi:MAG: M4 family metallopeptidase [Rhodanobacteraceae bacterium]|nr:M4 family metallopeptidase [Rhodanobacteraceae bacterium]
MEKSHFHRRGLVTAVAALAVIAAQHASGMEPRILNAPPNTALQSVERAASGDNRILGFSTAPTQAESAASFFQTHAAEFGLSAADTIQETASLPDDLGNVVHHYVQFHRGVQVLDSLYVLYERDGRVTSGHGNLFPHLSVDVAPAITAAAALEKGKKSLSIEMAAKISSASRVKTRLGLIMQAGSGTATRPRLAYRISDDAAAASMDVDAKTGELIQSWSTRSELSAPTPAAETTPRNNATKAAGPGGTTQQNVSSVGMTLYDGLQPLTVRQFIDTDHNYATYHLGRFQQDQLPGINFWNIPRMITVPATGALDFAAMIASRTPYVDPDTSTSLRTGKHGPALPSIAPPGGADGKFDDAPPAWYPALSQIISLQNIHSFINTTFPSPSGSGGFRGFDGSSNLTYDAYYVSDQLANAFFDWGSNFILAGGGNGTTDGPMVDLDILAHEVGHGIIHKAPANAGYAFTGDAAAIDEGFSDVLGKIVEFGATPTNFSWSLGHRVTIGSRVGIGYRNLATPGAISDSRSPYPTTAGGPNYLYFPPGTACTDANDRCGSHHNATIIGHWYYRLVTGGTGTNELGQAYDVFPLGPIAARRIAFLTMQQLGPAPSFASVRAASLNAASVLYPDPVPGWVKSPEYIATMDAWSSVGVGDRFGAVWDNEYLAINLTPNPSATLKDVPVRVRLKYGYESNMQFELSNSATFTPNPGATPPQAMIATAVATNRTATPFAAEARWNLKPATNHYWRARTTATDSTLCAGREAFCTWVRSRATTTAPRLVTPPEFEVHAHLPAHEWAWKHGVDVYYDPVSLDVGSESGMEYRLELANPTSPDFTTLVYAATTRGDCDPLSGDCGSFTVSAPKNKTLLARVRARSDWRDSLFNEYATSYSETLSVVTPDVTVNLTAPANNVRIAPFGDNAIVRMAWTTSGVLSEPVYDIRSGASLLGSSVVSPSFDFDLNNQSGITDGRVYNWRVTARSPTLFAGPYALPAESVDSATTRSFTVDFSLAPRAQGNEPANGATQWQCSSTGSPSICALRFAWNSIPRASSYVLHVKRPNGTVSDYNVGSALNKTLNDVLLSGSSAGRVYEWWVTTKGPAPSLIAVDSSHRTYVVKTLASAVNASPTNGQSIEANANPITFSWSSVDSNASTSSLFITDVTTGSGSTYAEGPASRGSASISGVRTPGHTYRWRVRTCPPTPAGGSPRDCSESEPFTYSVRNAEPINSALAFELEESTNADFDMVIQDPTGRVFTYDDPEHYVQDTIGDTGPDIAYWSSPPHGTYHVAVRIYSGNGLATSFRLRALRNGSVVSAPNFPSNQAVVGWANVSGNYWPATGDYTYSYP